MSKTKIAFGLIILVLVAACGIDNTMYNARNYFKSAQDRPLNNMGRPTAQAVDEYTKAIKKCGMILSDGGKGPRAHDALFLMARALYYKGNSAFQAKDAFESLINGYPNSAHVPAAHIYLAKVMRDINQPAESERILEQFVRNPKFIKHHPQALLVLADFEIRDKDYHRAQFWLERIILDYPNTKEFKEASFLFGKNYYMQKDYQRSLEEFEKINRTRKIEKSLKLEAQYYIALNEFSLGRIPQAQKTVKSLIRNEIRPDKLAAARVLYARCLLASGEHDAGLAEIDAVTKTYLRTEQSADAFYHLGEYYYYQKGDITNAVSNLNRVRTEFSNSILSPIATQKATALNQLLPKANLNSETNLQQFLDHHYLRAEYFIKPLALPDSAFSSYQTVIDDRLKLASLRDTLLLEISYLQASMDSLAIQIDSLSTEPDPEQIQKTEPPVDTEPAPELIPNEDSEPEADVSDEPKPEEPQDEIEPQEGKEPDSVDKPQESDPDKPDQKEEAPTPPDTHDSRAQQMQAWQDQINAKNTRMEALTSLIAKFDSEIIPFCYFAQISILHNDIKDTSRRDVLFATMQQSYPRSKYTIAASMVMQDKTPELIDPDYNAARLDFDRILGYWPDQPDSLVTALQTYTESPYSDLQLRAQYRLGWHYSFEAPDSLKARMHLKEVLDNAQSGEYGTVTRRFFDGVKFLLRDPAPAPTPYADSLSTTELPEPEDPFLLFPALPDSLNLFTDPGFDFSIPALWDSLAIEDSLAIDDSLMVEREPESPREEENKTIQPEEQSTPEPQPAIKEEEILSE